MCGIVGLYLKNSALEPALGHHLGSMLVGMSARGPDSAGIAVYRKPVPAGSIKLTLFHESDAFDWQALRRALKTDLKTDAHGEIRGSHYVLVIAAELETVRSWLAIHHPELRVMGIGESIEIYKEKGLPKNFVSRFKLDELSGSHAVGHTRMATESAITTEHSHPFSTGADLCLVHNGSLSNHNRWRQKLSRRGIDFQTDNDTEVAAGYLSWRLNEGDSLREALEHGLKDLDGFYTFAIGTRLGFAVVRDAIACKPAVLAETDDWVAMASEYRSIAPLPGAEAADIWEPEPETIYTWERA